MIKISEIKKLKEKIKKLEKSKKLLRSFAYGMLEACDKEVLIDFILDEMEKE